MDPVANREKHHNGNNLNTAKRLQHYAVALQATEPEHFSRTSS